MKLLPRPAIRQQITSHEVLAIPNPNDPSSKEWSRVINRDVSRRNIMGIAIGGMAAACVPFEKTSPFWGTIGAGFRSSNAAPIDPDYVKKLPYASMLAWFEGGPKALMVLGEVTGDRRLTWYSAERQSLTTFGPFVVGLLGLDIELRGTILPDAWRANPLELVGAKLTRSLDVLAEGDRVQVPLTSTFEPAAVERVEILGVTRELRRVSEKVRYGGRTRYRNDYWVDTASGRCWKSRQIAVPTLPPLNLEITKYPTV